MAIIKHGDHYVFESPNDTYAIALPENKSLPVNVYWGPSGIALEDLPDAKQRQRRNFTTVMNRSGDSLFNELPLFYGLNMFECALKVTFPNGVRSVEFELLSEKISDNTLVLEYKERYESLRLTMVYKTFCNGRLLSRHTIISNDSNQPVILEKFASATWQIPGEYAVRLSSMHGHWCGEWRIQRNEIPYGKTVFESRTGLSGHHYVPAFIIDNGNATEESGTVYFGSLLWSGDGKITVERDYIGNVAVTGGINEFDNTLTLQPGESFTTPEFIAGRVENGFGEMSRLMHKFQRQELLPDAWKAQPRPFIFNGWSTLTVNVSEENILALMERAHDVGVELFVIDDGWQQYLGDWIPDKKKFPRGLRPVVEAAANYGIKLGLWVEIESFELASDLYKAHPEWAMQYPGRKPFTRERAAINRISVMLNLAIPEAAEAMYQALHKLIAETGIAYLKLDMNCYFTSPGENDCQYRTRIDHTRNLYKIFERLSNDFPEVLFENCASGAGRTDLAMSKYFGRINRSDNQDPCDVPFFQEGYSLFQLPFLVGGANHISDVLPHHNGHNTPLTTQATAGMLGSFACGKNLVTSPPEVLTEIAGFAKVYKSIRHITHNGEFYRLRSAYTDDGAAFFYCLPDQSEALLFVFRNVAHFGIPQKNIKLPALDSKGRYEVKSLLSSNVYIPETGGAFLKNIGLDINIKEDHAAELIYLKKLK